MFVTNCISTTKIQKISEITNFFRHYFLSRTEVSYKFLFKQLGAPTTVDVPIHKSPRNPDHIGSEFRGQRYNKMLKPTWYVPGTRTRYKLICETLFTLYNRLANRYLSILQFLR